MKKNFTFQLIMTFLMLTVMSFSQVPQLINYQAVARNSTGAILKNQTITLKVSIIDSITSGKLLYREIYSTLFSNAVSTNSFGLFEIKIGSGYKDVNSFSDIDWANNKKKYLKIEMDATGGNNFVDMGTTELLSVPFSLISQNTIEKQVLAFRNDTLFLKNGNFVYLGLYNNKKDIQNLVSKSKVDSLNFENNLTTESMNRYNGDSVNKYLINININNLVNEITNRINGENNNKIKEISDSNYLKGLIDTKEKKLTFNNPLILLLDFKIY